MITWLKRDFVSNEAPGRQSGAVEHVSRTSRHESVIVCASAMVGAHLNGRRDRLRRAFVSTATEPTVGTLAAAMAVYN